MQNGAIGRRLAWARYLFYADMSRGALDRWIEHSDGGEPGANSHFFALASQFLASLHVVLEDWERLGP